jgi:hypothetical protein
MLSREIVGRPRNAMSTVLDTTIGGRSLRLRRCVDRGQDDLSTRPITVMLDKPAESTDAAPERAYGRLRARIDRLEDTISHFYNVINELRERVSRVEKKLNL